MKFLKDLQALPFQIIDKAIFVDKTVTLIFKSGNKLIATCPKDKPEQYEILKSEIIKNLEKEKVEIYE